MSRSITRIYPGGQTALEELGPLVKARAQHPDDALRFVDGFFLVDTGAGWSCVADHVAQRLDLPRLDDAPIYTALGRSERPRHRAAIVIDLDPDAAGGFTRAVYRRRVFALPNLEQNLAHDPRLDAPLVGVIGRDILKAATVAIDGPRGSFTVDFGDA